MQDARTQYFTTFLVFILVQLYTSFLRLWASISSVWIINYLEKRRLLLNACAETKSQWGPVPSFSEVKYQISNNKIPRFAFRPVCIPHLPLSLPWALERFIVNFSIETRELQQPWNLNITHRIIHFIWSGKKSRQTCLLNKHTWGSTMECHRPVLNRQILFVFVVMKIKP